MNAKASPPSSRLIVTLPRWLREHLEGVAAQTGGTMAGALRSAFAEREGIAHCPYTVVRLRSHADATPHRPYAVTRWPEGECVAPEVVSWHGTQAAANAAATALRRAHPASAPAQISAILPE